MERQYSAATRETPVIARKVPHTFVNSFVRKSVIEKAFLRMDTRRNESNLQAAGESIV